MRKHNWKSNDWISVKDNIYPPLDIEVIVCRENQTAFSAYRKKFGNSIHWTNAVWDWKPIPHEESITHWMYMPEAFRKEKVHKC